MSVHSSSSLARLSHILIETRLKSAEQETDLMAVDGPDAGEIDWRKVRPSELCVEIADSALDVSLASGLGQDLLRETAVSIPSAGFDEGAR